MTVRAVPGTRIADPTTREIVYAPPEGADVIREKLAAWERFVHAQDDLDPLVRMAVTHYQFEAIHPFHDGSGRTGRMDPLHARRGPRVGHLDRTEDHSVRSCQEQIAEGARSATTGRRDAHLLAVLFEQPYFRISTVVERCEVSRQTASTWLHALVDAGLLQDVKVGRERPFVNHEFLEVLTRAD